MGAKNFPLAALVLLLFWRITSAQLSRIRGFHSYYGASEAPCGPGVQSRPNYRPQYQPYGRPASNYYHQGFTPYHAAMLDIDIPYHMMASGHRGYPSHQPYPQQNYYQQPPAYPRRQAATSYSQQFRDLVQRTRAYPQTPAATASQSYSPSVTRRRVKRQAMMFPPMHCQCDSAADCNMMATIRGRNYNHQCEGRLRLVCCCRGA